MKLTTALLLIGTLHAGDWPQILGPERDGIAVGESLLPEWPRSGPKVVWTAEVGQGFAGVAVKDKVVFLFHRRAGEEILQAFDAEKGTSLWSSPSPCKYRGGMSSDSGPRCVPLVTEESIVTFGVGGGLRCVEKASGKEVWIRDTWKDFGALEGYFGAGSTPLNYKDRVIVNVGGRNNAGVVAFSLKDGSTVWQAVSDTASYSSPVVATVDGVDHAIVVTRLKTVSLNPDDGEVRFEFPFGMRGPTVNGANPVVMGNQLFVSSSYRVGSVWAKFDFNSCTPVSSGERLLATQYATPIKHNGLLYAVDGRQDIGSASIKCIDPKQQKELWGESGFDYGTMIRAGDDLLFLSHGGELIRIAADPAKYRETHRSRILDSTARGYRLPALSNGYLYVRDDKQLKCLHVGNRK